MLANLDASELALKHTEDDADIGKGCAACAMHE